MITGIDIIIIALWVLSISFMILSFFGEDRKEGLRLFTIGWLLYIAAQLAVIFDMLKQIGEAL